MRWIVVLLSVIALGLQYRLWIGPGSWADIAALQRQLGEQQQQNQRLIERNQLLEADIRDLKVGTQGVEEQARSDLALIGQNETFYMLVSRPER